MDRHWPLTFAALAGIVAGFALFAVGSVALAGVVTASGAYGLVVPEFLESRRGVEVTTIEHSAASPADAN